jgi:RNA polymerase sigma factor (sigma-70 family)
MFDDFAAFMLSYIARLRKKKLTYIDRPQAVDRLVLYLVLRNNKELKFKIFQSLSLERFYIFKYLSYCMETLKTVNDLWLSYLEETHGLQENKKNPVTENKLSVLRKKFGLSLVSVFSLMKFVEVNLVSYSEYRQKVISHYYKLCYKKAKSYFKDKPNLGYDIDEVYQDYLIAVAKAIDKYRASRGAVTSYINWWILNVSTCDYSSHEYGIAYTVPASHRRDIANHRVTDTNFAVSLDIPVKGSSNDDTTVTLKDKLISEDSDHAEIFAQNDHTTRFRNLIKSVDPLGIARISLGIDEVFNSDELALMKRHRAYCERKYRISNSHFSS